MLRQREKAKANLREQPSQLKSGQELIFEMSILRPSWEEVNRVAPEREVSQP